MSFDLGEVAMVSSPRSVRLAALATGGLTAAAAIAFSAGASAAPPTYSVSGCSASLLQLSIGGNAIPIPSASCPDDGDAFVPPIDVPLAPLGGGVHAQVLYEYASANPDSGRHNAEAGVAKLVVVLQGHTIGADVLTSQADCDHGQPSGQSQVVDLNLDGNHLTVPDSLQQPHDLVIDQLSPVVTVAMNQQDTPPATTRTSTTPAGTTVTTTRSLTQTALEVKALIGTPLEVDLIVAQTHVDCSRSEFTPTPPPPPPPPGGAVGWMSGGGQLNASETHSLVLPCTTTQAHPKPKLNVETPSGRFTLDTLNNDVSCFTDSRAGSPEQPDAGFNTITGSGKGTCNGVSNIPVSFRFTDEGEPNKGADKASITITGPVCPVNATGTVNGNQQAHRGHNPPA
jgi:hypothetical protein